MFVLSFRRGGGAAFAGAAAAILVGSGASAAVTTATPLQFDGARLGMPLSAWKALPTPDADGAKTRCAPAEAALVCSYVSPDEDVSLPLIKTYRARGPQFDFVSGALSKIQFRTSIDAFDDVMAMLETQYGPPSRTLRDNVDVGDNIVWPRVREIWRLSSGSIELTDPTKPANQLSVQFDAGPITAP